MLHLLIGIIVVLVACWVVALCKMASKADDAIELERRNR